MNAPSMHLLSKHRIAGFGLRRVAPSRFAAFTSLQRGGSPLHLDEAALGPASARASGDASGAPIVEFGGGNRVGAADWQLDGSSNVATAKSDDSLAIVVDGLVTTDESTDIRRPRAADDVPTRTACREWP